MSQKYKIWFTGTKSARLRFIALPPTKFHIVFGARIFFFQENFAAQT